MFQSQAASSSCRTSHHDLASNKGRELWSWAGEGYKRPGGKGKSKKLFFRSIQRGKDVLHVNDCAVFLSTGRSDRPYIGKIEMLWETSAGSMMCKVKWFYHPEEIETCGRKFDLKLPVSWAKIFAKKIFDCWQCFRAACFNLHTLTRTLSTPYLTSVRFSPSKNTPGSCSLIPRRNLQVITWRAPMIQQVSQCIFNLVFYSLLEQTRIKQPAILKIL